MTRTRSLLAALVGALTLAAPAADVGHAAPPGADSGDTVTVARRRGRGRSGGDPAARDDDPVTRTHNLETSASESIGRAARGRLRNGVPLLDSPTVDVRSDGDGKHYGTAELVSLLEFAAAEVEARHPGARMNVGDLSKRGGGRLGSHRSHRSGRDVDIGFYFLDESGAPVEGRYFVRFDREGRGVTGWSGEEVTFDVVRNWALLEAMMRFPGTQLQYVFVSGPLQAMLLAEAARTGASPETIARATALMSHSARGHDNHFHVRIACPASDGECVNHEPRRRRLLRRRRHRD